MNFSSPSLRNPAFPWPPKGREDPWRVPSEWMGGHPHEEKKNAPPKKGMGLWNSTCGSGMNGEFPFDGVMFLSATQGNDLLSGAGTRSSHLLGCSTNVRCRSLRHGYKRCNWGDQPPYSKSDPLTCRWSFAPKWQPLPWPRSRSPAALAAVRIPDPRWGTEGTAALFFSAHSVCWACCSSRCSILSVLVLFYWSVLQLSLSLSLLLLGSTISRHPTHLKHGHTRVSTLQTCLDVPQKGGLPAFLGLARPQYLLGA